VKEDEKTKNRAENTSCDTWAMLKTRPQTVLKDVLRVFSSKPSDEQSRQMAKKLLDEMGVGLRGAEWKQNQLRTRLKRRAWVTAKAMPLMFRTGRR
jgi:hypothetical protein